MKRPLAVVVLACGLAACGGTTHRVVVARLASSVLQTQDLPTFTRFQSDPGTHADLGSLASGDRISGWIARFRRGSSVVVSRTDVYRTSDAAAKAFAALRSAVSGPAVQIVAAPTLGDAHFAYSMTSTMPVRGVIWRRTNAIASVLVEGTTIARGEAQRLARRQDDRLRSAER